MGTLDIDEKTFERWRQRARTLGLSVEDWLHQLVKPDLPKTASEMSPDEWINWLHEFASRHPPTGYPVDDSRESIYD